MDRTLGEWGRRREEIKKKTTSDGAGEKKNGQRWAEQERKETRQKMV